MRIRLLAAFLAVVFILLAAQDLPLISYLQAEERQRVTLSLERDAWQLATSAEPALVDRQYPQLQLLSERYSASTLSRVEIVDAAGTVLASTKPGEIGFDYGNRPEIASALSGVAAIGERDSVLLGGRMLFVTVPIQTASEITGALRLTYPVASIDQIVRERLRVVFLTGALTLAIAIVSAFWLAGVFTRRLRGLHAATEQLASGDLTARIPMLDGGAPEIRSLEHAFNTMATRLQTLVESQQAFASDASHQLRTPLTALRLRLENMASDSGDRDSDAIEQAINEVQRLQVLVDGLLALARLEGTAVALERVDVDDVLRGRTELWQPLAAERDVELLVSPTGGAAVSAVPNALEQILDAYLDNALEYAPTGSQVSVRVDVRDAEIEFHVTDEGRGIDAAMRQRAFDRFWRERAEGTGSGLGLAIAARLAEASGGTVRLDANQPTGVDAVAVLQRSL